MTGYRLFLRPLIVLAAILAAVPVGAQDVHVVPEPQTVPDRVTHPYATEPFIPVDSLYYDDGDNFIDFSFGVSGADELYLAVRFDAESDFDLTHVRFWGRRDGDAVSGDVTVDVYDGAGFTPDGSTLLYSQTYPDLLTESNQFRYVELDTPLSFAAGDGFFIVVRAEDSPEPGGPLGGDLGPGTGDYAGRSFFGAADLDWTPAGDFNEDGFDEVFLIRAVTDDGEPPTVCDGDIALTTQAEVDAFDCTEVAGNLEISDGISGGDITDLSTLAELESVGGDLEIQYNDLLTSLTGLESLTSVGGLLWFTGNEQLQSFEGLEGLVSVGDDFRVFSHPTLTSFAGLERLASIGDDFAVNNNAALGSLEGLESLTSISDRVEIGGNAVLSSLSGLENLTTLGGLGIFNHPELTTLAALENLTTVGPMTIGGNSVLESLEGLEGLTSIGGALVISENASLTSLEALSNLTTVENILGIAFNPVLESLNGLEGITSVGSELLVIENATLSNCACGLAGVISGDPPMFSGVGGMITVENNDPDGACISPQVVLDAYADAGCMPVTNEPSATTPDRFALMTPYPNPFTRSTTIAIGVPSPTDVRLAVYDVLGREVAVLVGGPVEAGWHEVVFDASGLPSGSYFVRMIAEHESKSVRRVTLVR
jgi:hypothetical protein